MRWSCTLLLLVGATTWSGQATAQTLDKIKDSIEQQFDELTGVDRYIYVDEQGREVQVENLSSVPEQHRDSVRRVRVEHEADASLFSFEGGAFGAGEEGQTIYKYVGSDGRTVYTNIAENVPPNLRDESEMDLSHIPLNSELGRELDRRLHEAHARLRGSQYCSDLHAAVRAGPWKALWDEYAPLIVCGFALLAFIFATPFFMRRIGVSAWKRTLTMAIPVLALAGLSMYGMTYSTRRMSEMRSRLKPCTKEAWNASAAPVPAPASDDEAPQTGPGSPLVQHARLVQQLQRQIAAAEKLQQNTSQGIE
jgi:hypothetical protein